MQLIHKKDIIQWLDSHNVTCYKIKEDTIVGYVVNVENSVILSHRKLKNIPVHFGTITGDFDCSSNELTNLSRMPYIVGGSFICFDNRIISLKGAPRLVGGDFDCSYNQLVNLVGGPLEITGEYFPDGEKELVEYPPTQTDERRFSILEQKLATYRCSHNYIESLEGAPTTIKAHFDASYNLLENLLYCPKEITGYLNCSNNYLKELKDFPTTLENQRRSSLVNNKNLHICQQSFNLAEVAALLEREKLSAQLRQNDKKMVIKI